MESAMDVSTDESRAKAAREWAKKLAPLVDESLTAESILDDTLADSLEILGLWDPDEPHRFGKYESEKGNKLDGGGYFMLVADLFGERVAWWESPPAEMIKWVTRHEAALLTNDGRDRLRNYEYEMELRSKGYWDHYIGESCPFDAHWSTWGSKHPEGIETNRLYDERTKALYSVVDCPNCGEHFGGYGKRGTRWNGPNFDGTCQSCEQQIIDPPHEKIAMYHRRSR